MKSKSNSENRKIVKKNFFPNEEEIEKRNNDFSFTKIEVVGLKEKYVNKTGNLLLTGAEDRWIKEIENEIDEKDRTIYNMDYRIAGKPKDLRKCMSKKLSEDELVDFFDDCITFLNYNKSMINIYHEELEKQKEYKKNKREIKKKNIYIESEPKDMLDFLKTNIKVIKEKNKRDIRYPRKKKDLLECWRLCEKEKEENLERNIFIDVSKFIRNRPSSIKLIKDKTPDEYIKDLRDKDKYRMVEINGVLIVSSDFNSFRGALVYKGGKELEEKYSEDFQNSSSIIYNNLEMTKIKQMANKYSCSNKSFRKEIF